MLGAIGRWLSGRPSAAELATRRAEARAVEAKALAIAARFDNALTTDENRRSWFGADGLSAKAANSYAVRRQLRNRSRYEVGNNPYLFGVCCSNATDLVDTGPTLQLLADDAGYNRAVMQSWREWCEEVGYAGKVRTCKLAKTVDGEGFIVLKGVNELEHRVKLYPCDIEADQVTTPAPKDLGELWVDGLTLHPVTGKPTHYSVLRHHPGDFYFPDFNPLVTDRVPARYVIHWFQQFRPGQVRGVPAFTSSLDLFSELRAFRKATLRAAEIAADLAAVLESEYPADPDDADAEVVPFSKMPIDRGMQVALPHGVKMSQFKAEHPATTYEMFQEKCLCEAVRPLAYPLNLALGTSQKFNFSSAKLDHVNYRSSLRVERTECEAVVLNPTFRMWFEEAVLCGAVPAYDGLRVPPHEWHWPGFEPLDPLVDAQTDQIRLAGGMLTFREFFGSRGKDWRKMLRQLAREMHFIEKLGLSLGDVVKRTVTEAVNTTDATPEAANAA